MTTLFNGLGWACLALAVWMVFIPVWNWALGFFILALLFGALASEVKN